MNSPHKGQWRGALVFSFICHWIDGGVNNREAGDLRHHRTHYYVSVDWAKRCDKTSCRLVKRHEATWELRDNWWTLIEHTFRITTPNYVKIVSRCDHFQWLLWLITWHVNSWWTKCVSGDGGGGGWGGGGVIPLPLRWVCVNNTEPQYTSNGGTSLWHRLIDLMSDSRMFPLSMVICTHGVESVSFN